MVTPPIPDVFDTGALVFALIFAGIAAIIAIVIGVVKSDGSRIAFRIFESLALTFLGAILARGFIHLLLASAADVPAASWLVGWGFMIINSILDLFVNLFSRIGGTGEVFFTRPDVLMWVATFLGAFTGMMGGLWSSYRWDRLGVFAFVLDVTWGLNGMLLSTLLHIINFAWADHSDDVTTAATLGDRRRNNHRYRRGVALKPGFALTLGNVMSNCYGGGNPSPGLWTHENTHVWQNRVFGPFFTLSYLGWFITASLLFGLWAGLARYGFPRGLMEGPTEVGYLSNPWEVWAYKVGESMGESPRSSYGPLVFSDVVAIITGIIFSIAFIALMVALIAGAW